jgi:hypothetical protein
MSFSHDDLLPDNGAEAMYGVTFREFASAVCIWASLQREPPSVAQCADSFNATVSLISDVVRDSYPAYLRPEFEPDMTKVFIHFIEGP